MPPFRLSFEERQRLVRKIIRRRLKNLEKRHREIFKLIRKSDPGTRDQIISQWVQGIPMDFRVPLADELLFWLCPDPDSLRDQCDYEF